MSAPRVNPIEEWESLTPLQRGQYVAYLETWAIGQDHPVATYFRRLAFLVRNGIHPRDAITRVDIEFEETT